MDYAIKKIYIVGTVNFLSLIPTAVMTFAALVKKFECLRFTAQSSSPEHFHKWRTCSVKFIAFYEIGCFQSEYTFLFLQATGL